MRQVPGARRQGTRVANAVFFLGVLASGAWNLSCKAPGRDAIAEVQEAADSADQLMIGLKQYMTNNGVRQAYLKADTGFVYEVSGRVDLKRIYVTFYSASGDSTSTLTARLGFYNMRTGLMEARGNVVVIRRDGARLVTEDLIYDQSRNEVHTDSTYVMDNGDQHGTGVGFTSDPTFTNIRSTAVKGTAGRFTLPGQ